MTRRAVMPIMGSTLLSEIPFAILVPHAAQAKRNHHQSLERLAERDGLSPCEAVAILEDRAWHAIRPQVDAERSLINKVREWRAAINKSTDTRQPNEGDSQ